MSTIGFIQTSKIQNNEVINVNEIDSKTRDNALLLFDSNNNISLEDARHNSLVLGSTGSGKTYSAVLPATYSFIRKGYAGIIIDIKGNLRDQVYSLAKACGREKDLVEFGTAASATPLNLLANMDPHEVHETIKTLTLDNFQGQSHNLDFHMKGVEQAVSCAQLLSYLSEKENDIAPNLCFISELITDLDLASILYKHFLDSVYDENNFEQKEFVSKIESCFFHLFNYSKHSNSNNQRESSRYFEQLNYCLDTVRAALNQFISVPGIASGFADNNKTNGLDMQKLILGKKIVLLRFEPDSGPIGAAISRTLIEAYYRAIYTIGVTKAQKNPSFICMDEFQEVADLSHSRFSDMKFISQAREFNAHFLASTQSVSALVTHSTSSIQVNAFLANCNNRIIFYSDDPFTQEFVSRLDFNTTLKDLKSSEAFVARYDSENRSHHYQIETFHRLYAEVCELMKKYKKPSSRVKKEKNIQKLREIIMLKIQTEKLESASNTSSSASQTQGSVEMTNPTTTAEDIVFSMEENAHEEKNLTENPFSAKIHKEFAEFFSTDGDELSEIVIPIGWEECLINALRAFRQQKFNYKIKGFYVDDGRLRVFREYRNNNASEEIMKTFLDELLRATLNTCSLCGTHIKIQDGREINICKECLQVHNIAYDEEVISPYL